MNITAGNVTVVCPNQSDSLLDIASSWIGIVTFISTTLGGLTIFYTLYKNFEKAQEGILDFSSTVATSSGELVADVEMLEPILRQSSNHELLKKMMDTVARMRRLTSQLDTAIRLRKIKGHGIRSVLETYRFSSDKTITTQMNELQRLANSLQVMRINMVLLRLEEQGEVLQRLAKALIP